MEGKENMCGGMCKEWMMKHPMWKKVICIAIVLLVIIGLIKLFAPDRSSHNPADQHTIVVSGKGELNVKPDIAEVSFSVLNENKDVSKASDAVNTSMTAIVAKLKADGVADADIKTTGYDISPRYNYVYNEPQIYPQGGTQTLAGYDVTQSVDIKIRDLSKAGQVVTDLGVLGVTNMSGLSFTEDKYDDLVRQARDQAIVDARSQAENLAKALGVRLGSIVSYSEGGNYPRPMYATMSAGASSDMAKSAVLPTGENTIDSNVSITYEIK